MGVGKVPIRKSPRAESLPHCQDSWENIQHLISRQLHIKRCTVEKSQTNATNVKINCGKKSIAREHPALDKFSF